MAISNAQRIELGIFLRQYRDRIGLAQDAVEAELGWHAGKVSRVELGKRTVVKTEIDRLVLLYELNQDEADLVRRLGAEARKRDVSSRVADWAQTYVAIERSATEIQYYDAELVPGAMQVASYARAVLAVSHHPDPDPIIGDRLKRQELLTRDNGPQVSIVLGEAALHRRIGGAEVLREQLEHLLAMSRLANVSIRVLDFEAGAHPALGVGFTFVRLGGQQVSRVYLEGLSDGTYLHLPADTLVYRQVFNQLWAAALGDRQSATILRRRIADLE
ncbi:helix-turn-helix domain-containing protein [Solihabitans fulvus]|uniref:helix-turn-helix domain-containing protein n=1 Tax=Solihabitans fulvus TaxID=1892852 RepID=UPI0016620641|nr:helix-turn-helix transcriptional regulator [Solihabitans fulvus]